MSDPTKTIRTNRSGKAAAAARDAYTPAMHAAAGAGIASSAYRALRAEAARILAAASELEQDARHGRGNPWHAAGKLTNAAAALVGLLRVVVLAVLLAGAGHAATALDSLDADLARASADYQAAERAAYGRFLAAAKLVPLPAPELGADPRASEVDRHRQLAAVNKTVKALAELRDLPGGWSVEQVRRSLDRAALADYFAIRAGDEATAPEKPAGHAPTGGLVKPAR